MSEIELEELAAEYVREMRKEGLPRSVLVKPGENKPQADQSLVDQPDDELELPF